MSGLFTIALADLASRRLTTALTVVAILLGTAVVAATFTTNVAVEESMRESALAVVGDADLIVEALDDQGFGASVVPAVRALPDVALVAPRVEKRTFYRTADARGFVQVVGIDPAFDPVIRPYELSDGRTLRPDDGRAALVGREWAAAAGLQVGATIELITIEGFRSFEIVGLLEDAGAGRGSEAVVRVPLAVAQPAFGLDGRVHSLSLVVADKERTEQVAASLAAAVPYLYVVRDRAQALDDLSGSIADFQAALYLFGAIALLAGGVLVFNSLSLSIAERTRELGLLRAIGARGVLVVRLTVAQGLLLGLMGAALGVIAGQALGVGLVYLVGASQGIPIAGVPISVAGLAASFGLGVGVTVLAAILPALRAGRTSPLSVMSPGRSAARAEGRRLSQVAAVLAAALAIFTLLPLEGQDVRLAKALALLVLVPLFVYLGQFLIPALAAVAALPVRRISRGVGVIAERTVRRERGMTTLTAASFLISLALIVALYNGAASFASAGQEWAAELFPGEMVVVSPVDQPLELVAEFVALDGVDQVSPVSSLPVIWQGVRLTAVAVDPTHYFQAFEFAAGERTAAFRELRRGGGVLIPAALAAEMELAVGDELPLRAGDAEGGFTVAGVIVHSLPTPDNFGALVISRQDAEDLFGVRTFRFLAVSAAPGADLARLETGLQTAAETFGMQADSQASLARSIGDAVGGMLGLLVGLVLVGVVVGALGLVNTMMLSIAQRAREIGILRALGVGRGQVRALAIAEAAIMGFLGATLGVLLGAYLTWVLVDLSRTPDIDPRFSFSIPFALALIAGGVAVAMLASLYPSGRAARTGVLEALRHHG